MVRLSARPRIGKVSAAFGVVTGLVSVALGVGLVLEAESGFGRAWAAAFVVFGLVSTLGAVVSARPVEPGAAPVRAAGVLSLVLLGGWAAVTAVIGATQESWIWGLVLGVPAAWLLWAAARTTGSRSAG